MGAPFISIIVLSAVVVPWTRMSRLEHSSASGIENRSASWVSPFMTPVDWSSVVVGVLSSTTSPSGVTQMTSVNVPPTSIPTRYPPMEALLTFVARVQLRMSERTCSVASVSIASVRSSSEPVRTTP